MKKILLIALMLSLFSGCSSRPDSPELVKARAEDNQVVKANQEAYKLYKDAESFYLIALEAQKRAQASVPAVQASISISKTMWEEAKEHDKVNAKNEYLAYLENAKILMKRARNSDDLVEEAKKSYAHAVSEMERIQKEGQKIITKNRKIMGY